MFITKQTDYALRILRELSDHELHSAKEISEAEMVPQPFMYKITKKIAESGWIEIIRGTAGGYRLVADLEKISLYDLMQSVEDETCLSACMKPGYDCPWQKKHKICKVHGRLSQIQQKMNKELMNYSLAELLSDE